MATEGSSPLKKLKHPIYLTLEEYFNAGKPFYKIVGDMKGNDWEIARQLQFADSLGNRGIALEKNEKISEDCFVSHKNRKRYEMFQKIVELGFTLKSSHGFGQYDNHSWTFEKSL